MIHTEEYPFKAGDIVASVNSGAKGVVRSVGQFGHQITALVTWFDTRESSHIEIGQLKKTLRGIDGGKDKDPDT